MQSQNKALLYSGLVWIVAAIALGLYALAWTVGIQVPGVEQLVMWLERLDGNWVLLAAFVSILVEGLYFFGSFLPGSTLVVVVAVLAQLQSWLLFTLTILSIFLGWVVAGVLNILFAIRVRNAAGQAEDPTYVIEDHPWETWFPAFRANYEVAQVMSGGSPWRVFWSSVRVKVWGSIGATIYVLVLPLLIDIKEMENEEGFIVMLIVAGIMFVVGAWQVRESRRILEGIEAGE